MKHGLILMLTAASPLTQETLDHAHHHAGGDSFTIDGSVQFAVQVNPEARVSVQTGSPPKAKCGGPVTLVIKVSNQTGRAIPLHIVPVAPSGMIVVQAPASLSGAPEDHRTAIVFVPAGPAVDVTFRFHAGEQTEDLGGRARAHMLLQCIR